MKSLRDEFPNLKVSFSSKQGLIDGFYVRNPYLKETEEELESQEIGYHGTKLENVKSIM
jgi:hypothetical protein